MGKIEDDFLKKLLSTFKIEAQEHINAMSSGLMKLEKASTAEEQMDLIETIFREAHSLKGAARAVNMAEMEALCQAQEGVFAALKRKEITLSPSLLDVLHQSVDRLGKLLLFTQDKETGSEKSRATELISNLESALTGVLETPIQDALRTVGGEGSRAPKPEAGPPLVDERPVLAATVRIPTAKLDLVLRQAEELRSAKLAAAQRAAELRALSATLAEWKTEWAKVQPEMRRVKQLLENKAKRNSKDPTKAPLAKLLTFLDWHQTQAKSLESQLTALAKATEHDQRSLGSMVDNLLEDMKTVLMLPFSVLLESFPKLVRELARDQGKDVELAIRGGEIEIDRRILEEVKDPLIHLVRNSIHHGIEKPEERESKNKPRRGTVAIAVAQKEGGKVEILISDDGAGIDTAKVQAAVLKLGLTTPGEAGELSEPEALSLIFRSGVSTSPIITDIAGRGLGLAIVWEKVEKLGGSVSCETRARWNDFPHDSAGDVGHLSRGDRAGGGARLCLAHDQCGARAARAQGGHQNRGEPGNGSD